MTHVYKGEGENRENWSITGRLHDGVDDDDKRKKTGVYDVIGQSKAPYKLSSTCPPLGTREHNTKQYFDGDGDGDGGGDDDDGDNDDDSAHPVRTLMAREAFCQ